MSEAAAALEVDGLSVDLAGVRVLHDVSFAIPAGAFAALTGPSGSGKTTLLRAIGNAVGAATGQVRLDGTPVPRIDRRTLARTVAVLRQEPRLDFDFLVEEVVMMGRSPYKGLLEPDHASDRAIVDECLGLTDARHLVKRTFTTLSGGEKQRVLLARALAQRPSLLLLDEPTNHLDIGHQLGLVGCVRGLGITVLAALHDLPVALRFATEAVLLENGRLAACGPIDEVLSVERVASVFGVTAHRLTAADGTPTFAFSEPGGRDRTGRL